jgi:hypothetical protein
MTGEQCGMVKKLFIGVFSLVLLLVVGVIIALLSINTIARKGIESGATYALGVKTTLSSASIGLFSGSMGLSKLDVANPEGFKQPRFFGLGDGQVAVSLGSLREQVITVPTLRLDTIDLNLEKSGGKSNYGVILDNLAKLSGPKGDKPAEPAGGGKRFVINDLVLSNITIRVDMLDAGALGAVGQGLTKAATVTIPLKEIRLQNVGKTGTGVAGSGVTMSQLTSIIMQAIMAAAAEKGGGLIPADMLGDLQGKLASLPALKDLGITATSELGKVADQVGKVAEDAAKKAGEVGKGAVDEGKKAIDDATKGLKGLIPGSK